MKRSIIKLFVVVILGFSNFSLVAAEFENSMIIWDRDEDLYQQATNIAQDILDALPPITNLVAELVDESKGTFLKVSYGDKKFPYEKKSLLFKRSTIAGIYINADVLKEDHATTKEEISKLLPNAINKKIGFVEDTQELNALMHIAAYLSRKVGEMSRNGSVFKLDVERNFSGYILKVIENFKANERQFQFMKISLGFDRIEFLGCSEPSLSLDSKYSCTMVDGENIYVSTRPEFEAKELVFAEFRFKIVDFLKAALKKNFGLKVVEQNGSASSLDNAQIVASTNDVDVKPSAPAAQPQAQMQAPVPVPVPVQTEVKKDFMSFLAGLWN